MGKREKVYYRTEKFYAIPGGEQSLTSVYIPSKGLTFVRDDNMHGSDLRFLNVMDSEKGESMSGWKTKYVPSSNVRGLVEARDEYMEKKASIESGPRRYKYIGPAGKRIPVPVVTPMLLTRIKELERTLYDKASRLMPAAC